MTRQPSRLRRFFKVRYAIRLCILAFTIVAYFVLPESFSVLNGLDFFRRFTWLHVIWAIWIVDMTAQLIPAGGYSAAGSLKQFGRYYKPARDPIEQTRLRRFFWENSLDSANVLVVWIMIITGIGVLKTTGLFGEKELLLAAVVFYVLDMTFILFWCPFQVWILKNRCCTTCRIYNWDHMMMFSPLVFIAGFYGLSLFGLSMVSFLVWEWCFVRHAERFSDDTNLALRCGSCTDGLCRSESTGRRHEAAAARADR